MTSDEFRAVPLSPRFTVHRRAGRTARRVRLLAGTSDWRRDLLDRLGAAALTIGGTSPWRAARPWPWPTISPAGLIEGLDLPGLRLLAAAAPRQEGRPRLSILAESGDDQVVIKLGTPDDGLENEAAALSLLTRDPLPGIATPSVVAAGRLDTEEPVAFLVTTALGLDGQRPALDEPLRTFEADLAERLGSLPRPVGTDAASVPLHGDLTPWNLRRTEQGLALFDWEAAGWGVPGSDLEHYRQACASLRRPRRLR